MALLSINPATEETLVTYDELTDAEVEVRLLRARAASDKQRRGSVRDRAHGMRNLAALLTQQRETHARLMTDEMGKTFVSALAEVEKCASTCRHYAEHAEKYLADSLVETEAQSSHVRHLPLGVILGVMPWNFPFWQVIRFAVPALMAGNVALLKHSSNVSGCSLALERLFHDAGFDTGVFQSLLIASSRVDALLSDERIAAVSLTGSEAAGAAVAKKAGSLIKKCVLELGGSDPFIVMPSTHLEEAVPGAVAARIINNGQSCIAAKRFIVHKACYDEFLRQFVHQFEELRVGSPLESSTDVGPIATRSGLEQLEQQVKSATDAGARTACGGKRLPGPGFYYAPTVLADIPIDAAINREEVFGPVALVYRVDDIDAAIRLANSTPFGLASSVWTDDEAEQARFVQELEAGQTFINALVASDPRLPFGGVKRSGYGRELGSLGILEFVNSKTVYIRRTRT